MIELPLLLALACAQQDPAATIGIDAATPAQEPAAPAASQPAPQVQLSWEERFAAVRESLEELRNAHQARKQEAVQQAWEKSYRERFEPLLEQPLRRHAPHQDLVATEYAFGRVLRAAASPREPAMHEALQELESSLATLEQAAVRLPLPTP